MADATGTPDLVVTSSPHVTPGESVPRIMHAVWISLIPACLVAMYVFGYSALVLVGLATLACVGFELIFLRLRGYSFAQARSVSLDGSAIISGILLALNLPASSPWWLVLIGALVTMSLGKHLFGGLGNNLFNPVLVARVFLLLSFPTQMLDFSPPVADFLAGHDAAIVDGETYATPLGKLKEAIRSQADTNALASVRAEITRDYPTLDLFLGFRRGERGKMGGSLGEISGLALLLGALFLLWRGCITWHIPVSFAVSTAAVTGGAWLLNPELYVHPLYHILSGGLLLGALYMATDMVTSPFTKKGMLIFGVGCGVITAVIRLWGAYPEGVSFAILIMNGMVPLIDKYTKPRRFGAERRTAA